MAYRRGWARDFDRAVRDNPDWPVAVSDGDSWFSFATQRNVIDHLDAPPKRGGGRDQRPWSLLRLENGADEMTTILAAAHRAHLRAVLDRYPVNALLFSGGFNDLLTADLPSLLQPFREGAKAAECVVAPRLERRLRHLEEGYRELLDMAFDDGAYLRIYVNSYDYPKPCERAEKLLSSKFCGPWIGPALRGRGYPAGHELERAVPRLLLDRFCAMLDRVAADSRGRLVRVETRGAVGDRWADESHPDEHGAAVVALQFARALEKDDAFAAQTPDQQRGAGGAA